MFKNKLNKTFILFLLFNSILNSQIILGSDPMSLIEYEYSTSLDTLLSEEIILRPIFSINKGSKFSLVFKNEEFFNTGGPNLENMDIRWVGKGFGSYFAFEFLFQNKIIFFTMEPFYFLNQNLYSVNPVRPAHPSMSDRPDQFHRLNDFRYYNNSPFSKSGIKELSFFINYKQLGFGFSNANMWFGPGLHSSLMMSNNSKGFNHIMIGTLKEMRVKNIGINIRYIFSQLNDVLDDPYYTAIVSTFTIYSDPIITFGFNRNYLSGGIATDRRFNIWDAALLVFEPLFRSSKDLNYPEDWDPIDPWDQLLSGYLLLHYPLLNLKLFLELATNDHRMDWSDARAQPDHAMAYTIGFRNYNLFDNPNLIGGMEYHNLKQSYTRKWRSEANWYDKLEYDYSSIYGRHWGAHSGPDSDDLYFFVGYYSPDLSLIPAINYERHGILAGEIPEVKIELRINTHFLYKNTIIYFYFEREFVNNVNFNKDKSRISNILYFGVEKDLTNLF